MSPAELDTTEKSFESIATSSRYSLGLILVWSLLWLGALYVGQFSATRHWLEPEGAGELTRYLGSDGGADQILEKRVDELYVKAPVIEVTIPITDYGYFAGVALVLIALWLSNTSDREYDLLSGLFEVKAHEVKAERKTVTLVPRKLGMTHEHAWLIAQWAHRGRALNSASGLGFQPSLFAFCVPLVPCTIQLALDAMEVASLSSWELLARRSLIHVACFVLVAIALLHVLQQQLRTKALLDLVLQELDLSWNPRNPKAPFDQAAALKASEPTAIVRGPGGDDTPVVVGATYASLTVVATALTFLVALGYEWHARTWIAVMLVVCHLILVATVAFSSPKSRNTTVRSIAFVLWVVGILVIVVLGTRTGFTFAGLAADSVPVQPDSDRWIPSVSILMAFVGWFATTTSFPSQTKAPVQVPAGLGPVSLVIAVALVALFAFCFSSLQVPLLVSLCTAPLLGRMLLFERARTERKMVYWALAAFALLFVIELLGLQGFRWTEASAYATTLTLTCSLSAIERSVAPETEVCWWLVS